MGIEAAPEPTWVEVIALAKTLEAAANTGSVDPAEGANLVKMILAFGDSVNGPRTPPAKPRGSWPGPGNSFPRE